jgi:DNA topoisomerase-2
MASITKQADARGKAKQLAMRTHILERGMWAGSKSLQEILTYIVENSVFVNKILKYPPVLQKLVDEIVVNAIDHYVTSTVSNIYIDFSADGIISVFNDGPGIDVELTKNLDGVEMYSIQMIFNEFLSGTNFNDEDQTDRITGGQNGLGSKIVTVFSDWLTISTTDEKRNMHYEQKLSNVLDKSLSDLLQESKKTAAIYIHPPTLTSLKDKASAAKLKPWQRAGHTKITFLPNYSLFKLTAKEFYPTFYKLIESRAWQAAAYVKAKVYFNNELIIVNSFAQICKMFCPNVLPITMTQPNGKYNWDLCIGITDGKEQHVSFVNGVIVGKGGTHIQHIQVHLVEILQPNIEKILKQYKANFNKNILLNNIFIIMKGPIANPQFDGQTKNTLSSPVEQFANYTIPISQRDKLWEFVKPVIIDAFVQKQLGPERTRANRQKIDLPKYREADLCRNAKRCLECSLIVAEGDSAISMADKGLTSKASENFNYSLFGTYSLQGVIINGLKESTVVGRTKSSTPLDTDIHIPNKKLRENERIAGLVKVLGLDYNKKYDFTPKGEKEYHTLRYGCIVGLTDADLDGFNIFGLLCTFFMTYWPNLVKRSFIKRINTPIVRAYPTARYAKTLPVEVFYTEKSVREFVESIGVEKANHYNFRYYKGLGSHDESGKKKEVTRCFTNIEEKIITYTLDDCSMEAMHIAYGVDTKPRKLSLSTPVTEEPVEYSLVPISQQFRIDTKLYQRDNILRKLLNAIDGFVSSRRKVFYAARIAAKKEIKVVAFAGEVVSKADYHHGSASVEETIIRMAQAYPGARRLPLLVPIGSFGSRCKGFKDSAAARYISTKLNYRLSNAMFRHEDDYVLEYEVNDGERFEPKYYVPIIPYVLCETNEIPATGWAISVLARDLNAVLKNVRNMILGKISKCEKLPISLAGFRGEIRYYNKRYYSVGDCIYDESRNVVIVTELPLGVYVDSYINGAMTSIKKATEEPKGIKSLEYVIDVNDSSTDDQVNIEITLAPNSYELIMEKYGSVSDDPNEGFNPLEDYLQLKEPIYNRVNLINENSEVVEYKTYEDVFDNWFRFRKDLYIKRIERERILNDLEIKMLKNQQLFSTLHDSYSISKKTKLDEMVSILEENKYNIFNVTLLNNPKYTSVVELVRLVTSADDGANYNYLINMNYRDLTEEAYSKRQARIKYLEDRQLYLLDETGIFPGAKIWLVELDELEQAIKDGQATEWQYGEDDFIYEGKSTKKITQSKILPKRK